MKRTLIPSLPQGLPESVLSLAQGANIYDSSCSPEARVYFLDKDKGYYLKIAPKGALRREAEMTAYFNSLELGTTVLDYISQDSDLLVTEKMAGEDCTFAKYLDDPKRLCDTLATQLRKLHEITPTGCPVSNRTAEYIATVDTNYSKGLFDLSLFSGVREYKNAHEAYRIFSQYKGALAADTLIHGDFCLPNVMLDDWRLSGFIDLGNGGVGDRHIDLFWGTWTLWFNLKTNQYKDRFIDAYGRDRVSEELLEAIAAAEVFG